MPSIIRGGWVAPAAVQVVCCYILCVTPNSAHSAPELAKQQYTQIYDERQNALQNKISALFSSFQLPTEPYSDVEVQHLLSQLAAADFNNFQKVGAGEREGRVYSQMVKSRNYNLAHGVGRSGDLLADQPKAAGSNMMHRLCRGLTKHAIQLSGFKTVAAVLITPSATGMTINYVLQALGVKSVIWLRCDQKSVPKALELLQCQVEVVDCISEYPKDKAPYTHTDYGQLEQILQVEGAQYDCIISTTSCFAPREPDDLLRVSRLIQKYNNVRYHVCNNAYGIQQRSVMQQMESCQKLDIVVSSLDKNFMVPVSGALVYGKDKELVLSVGRKYSGRASAHGILDLLITLLQMGSNGYLRLLCDRERVYEYAVTQLRMNRAGSNRISMYRFIHDASLGPQLFRRGVSGAKVNRKGCVFSFCGHQLLNFGLHGSSDAIISDYIVVASAIGQRQEEVDALAKLLDSL